VLGAAARPTFVLKGRTLTFASTPAAGTAIFCEYIHGTHAADGSTLAYQQTGRGYGGLDNALIDTGYSIRYMGKHMAMGLDWLWSNPGMTPDRRELFMRLMVQWADYFRDNGYQRDCAGSNYGVGGLVGRTLTAVVLAGRDRQNGPRLLSEVTAYRDHITATFLLHDTNPANPMTPATLRGGYWAEGWNYGALAAENLLYCGLALEESGNIPAAAQMERAWATHLVSQLLIGSSDAVEGAYPTQIVDFGDGYTYPASFPSPPLLAIVSDAADDDKARSHANYLLQYASKQAKPDPLANDYRELLFHDPTQPCAFWSELPLHWRAPGVELLCMRSGWGRNVVWAAASFGNLLDAGHQPVAAGALEVRRGVDDLLIYGPACAKDAVAFQEKTAAANTLVVDDGGAGAQNYRYQQGVWTGTPGNHVIAYEATDRWVYAAADLHAAYSLNTHPGEGGSVSEWVRSLVYLRPGYFVVHDRCTTKQPGFTKAVRWHAQRGKARLQGDQLQVSVGSSRAFVQPYSSVPLSVQLGTHTTDGVVMDEATVQIADAVPRARYLHVIQVGSSTASEMDTNAYIQSAEAKLEGIIVGSNVVMFAHTPPWGGADRYAVSAKTGEEIRHIVVGLPPDTDIAIVVGGSSTPSRTSSQGVLTFSTRVTGAPQIISLTAEAQAPR
jgi:hypothetical protein